MENTVKLVRVLFAIDVGVVLFCMLEQNNLWFINTQIAFFSSALIILGSFVGYKNLVTQQVESGNAGKDVLKEYEDKYDMYDESDCKWYVDDFNDLNKGLIWSTKKPECFYVCKKIEIITGEVPEKQKIKKLPWYKAFFLSFKGGLNLIRILGYGFLVLGFIYLNNKSMFDLKSFFFGLTIVPAVALSFLWAEKKKSEKN